MHRKNRLPRPPSAACRQGETIMPIINRMAELQDDVVAWRRQFHVEPELQYDVHRTAASVAERLRQFGCDEVVEGIGRTGVVGIIAGRGGAGPTIGLRADMDALPIQEASGKEWSSKVPGKMHACGHDGHTAMLLGAARYLAETRNFSGRAAVIFQPAEEGGAGGRAMCEDGLMDRFAIGEVYGLHNMPGLPVGQFAIRKGPLLAGTSEFEITVSGKGGHAAMPHLSTDPLVVAAQMVLALQTIVARGTSPTDSLVVSVTMFHAGDATNVIAESVRMGGTIRSLKAELHEFAERRMREIAAGLGAAHGVTIAVKCERGYPPTVNHDAQTDKAVATAREVAGDTAVNADALPVMGGEDFSFMLLERPGAFIFMGNGDTAPLHTPQYDFNDEAIPHGASYWARLVERLLPPGGRD
jgi:hippurate hydrolase